MALGREDMHHHSGYLANIRVCRERRWKKKKLGQLGALGSQLDSSTEWGLRAAYRLTAMKQYVKIDSGRRYAAAMLRKSIPLPDTSRVGDLVMYKRDQDAEQPGTEWHGPARVLGHDEKTVWMLHNATPISSTTYKIRPADAAEVRECDKAS